MQRPLKLEKYPFIKKFLSSEWQVVSNNIGNVKTPHNASFDVVWVSFLHYLESNGYPENFCSKVLFGKLVKQMGVEKVKRGSRGKQKFFYYPLKAMKGTKAEFLMETTNDSKYDSPKRSRRFHAPSSRQSRQDNLCTGDYPELPQVEGYIIKVLPPLPMADLPEWTNNTELSYPGYSSSLDYFLNLWKLKKENEDEKLLSRSNEFCVDSNKSIEFTKSIIDCNPFHLIETEKNCEEISSEVSDDDNKAKIKDETDSLNEIIKFNHNISAVYANNLDKFILFMNNMPRKESTIDYASVTTNNIVEPHSLSKFSYMQQFRSEYEGKINESNNLVRHQASLLTDKDSSINKRKQALMTRDCSCEFCNWPYDS